MVRKIRINEDFDQRLNYLMKQYGNGELWESRLYEEEFISDIDNDTVDIYSDIVEYICNSLVNNFIGYVPISYIEKNIYIADNFVHIELPCTAKYTLTNRISGPNKFDIHGDFILFVALSFEINDKEVRGKDLSLVTDIPEI